MKWGSPRQNFPSLAPIMCPWGWRKNRKRRSLGADCGHQLSFIKSGDLRESIGIRKSENESPFVTCRVGSTANSGRRHTFASKCKCQITGAKIEFVPTELKVFQKRAERKMSHVCAKKNFTSRAGVSDTNAFSIGIHKNWLGWGLRLGFDYSLGLLFCCCCWSTVPLSCALSSSETVCVLSESSANSAFQNDPQSYGLQSLQTF